jgi:hypothetical protein
LFVFSFTLSLSLSHPTALFSSAQSRPFSASPSNRIAVNPRPFAVALATSKQPVPERCRAWFRVKGTSTIGVGSRRRGTRGGGGRNATQRKQGSEASARARKPPTAHRHSPAEPSAAISAATLVKQKLLIPLEAIVKKNNWWRIFAIWQKHISWKRIYCRKFPFFRSFLT